MILYLLKENYHDIRYRLGYTKVNLLQKWYSNDKNHRVISTKIGNVPLLSLRTHPHDAYLIKPGEFLSLERKTDEINISDQLEVYNNDIEEDNEPNQIEIEDEHFSQPKEFKRSLIMRMLQINSNNKVEQSRPASSMKCKKNALGSDIECVSIAESDRTVQSEEKLISNLPFRPGSKHQFMQPLLDEIPSSKSSSNCSGVWKRVLNDVSASAARVSTGLIPTPSDNYYILSGDFVEAQLKDPNLSIDEDMYDYDLASLYGEDH